MIGNIMVGVRLLVSLLRKLIMQCFWLDMMRTDGLSRINGEQIGEKRGTFTLPGTEVGTVK